MLNEIGDASKVQRWYQHARKNKKKVMGFGHRVYKAYDPRARVLGPLAEFLVNKENDPKNIELMKVATALEHEVIESLGKEKSIFPNVDFYSGIVYRSLGIDESLFTPIFAVSRVSGWIARVMEYLETNRIFRPRAVYTGAFNLEYKPLGERG
jgi:citrate synthase